MLFADQIAMIPNIDLHDTLKDVRAGSTLCRSFGTYYVGSQRSQLTLWGVFGGGVSFTRRILSLLLARGRGYSGLVPKCTHQTHKSRVCNIYVRA